MTKREQIKEAVKKEIPQLSSRVHNRITDAILALEPEQKEKKLHAHLRNRCLMAFEELLFNHNADAVILPELQLRLIRNLIKDLQP
jgi:hypothetical protein